MTDQTHELIWKTYQDAWADIPAAERQQLLHQSVAQDCTFTSPTSDGKGLQELTATIEQFQKQFPGATFQTHKMIQHHQQALAEWIMYDKQGIEFLAGKSYARLNSDNRLFALVGFWELK